MSERAQQSRQSNDALFTGRLAPTRIGSSTAFRYHKKIVPDFPREAETLQRGAPHSPRQSSL